MKYIKTFENINNIEYSVGDIVICINNKGYVDLLSIGDHYLVMNIIDRFGK